MRRVVSMFNESPKSHPTPSLPLPFLSHHKRFGRRLLAQPRHADGHGERGVDARVVGKARGERGAARGARRLALLRPAGEAGQAVVVLAGSLRRKERGGEKRGLRGGEKRGLMRRPDPTASHPSLPLPFLSSLTVTGRSHSSMHTAHLSVSSNMVAPSSSSAGAAAAAVAAALPFCLAAASSAALTREREREDA